VKPGDVVIISKLMKFPSTEEFLLKYKEHAGIILSCADKVRRHLFSMHDGDKTVSWKDARDRLMAEVYESAAQRRIPDKAIIEEGLRRGDGIFELCASRCSGDRDILCGIVRKAILEKRLTAESWPVLMAIGSNPNAPKDVLVFIADMIRDKGPAWRHVREALYVNPGFPGIQKGRLEVSGDKLPEKNPRLAKNYNVNDALLDCAARNIGGSPVDISIDLSILGDETLASDMKTWAYIAAINSRAGIDARYMIFSEDPSRAGDAGRIMRVMIDGIPLISASEKEDLMGRIILPQDSAREGDARKAYKVSIINSSALEDGSFSVGDDLVVAIGRMTEVESIPVFDFMAANTIGLAQAACAAMRQRSPGELSRFVSQEILPKISDIYARLLPDEIITDATLSNMVSDNRVIRRNLAAALAIPAITGIPSGRVASYQDSVHSLLAGVLSSSGYGPNEKQIRRISSAVHSKNRECAPRPEPGRIICHIIADAVIPDAQLQLMQELQDDSAKEDYAEKLVRLTAAPDDVKNFMDELKAKMREQKEHYERLGYAVEFDIACPNVETVKHIQDELRLNALAFGRGRGNFVQIENIVLALRMLRSGDLNRLKAAFEFVTGERVPRDLANETDLAAFIKRAVFTLRAIVIEDYEAFKRLNDNIKMLIEHA
jgi:hypothetical protein